jgi:cytochrome c553
MVRTRATTACKRRWASPMTSGACNSIRSHRVDHGGSTAHSGKAIPGELVVTRTGPQLTQRGLEMSRYIQALEMPNRPTRRCWLGQRDRSLVNARQLISAMAVVLTALCSTGLHAQEQDTAAGKRIVEDGAHAGSPACSACHGIDGAGQPEAGIPSLAGLDPLYIERELLAFRTGTRSSPIMSQYASDLTPEQIPAVAAYLSSLRPTQQQSSFGRLEGAGRDLALSGRWSSGLPACASCHGQSGEGYNTAPALAGQSKAYLQQQLNAWREGQRPEGPDFFMTLLARKLSDSDVEAVAAYYASLPPALAAPSDIH